MTMYGDATTHQGFFPWDFPNRTDEESWRRIIRYEPNTQATGTVAGLEKLVTENSTGRQNDQELSLISLEIEHIFAVVSDEIVEDGSDTDLYETIEDLISKRGSSAVLLLSRHLTSGKVKGSTLTKALAILGQVRDVSSYYNQLQVLEKLLFSSSPRVRDGACLGLSFLDDPQSINIVKKAIVEEQILVLKSNLEKLLHQLENTANVTKSY